MVGHGRGGPPLGSAIADCCRLRCRAIGKCEEKVEATKEKPRESRDFNRKVK